MNVEPLTAKSVPPEALIAPPYGAVLLVNPESFTVIVGF